MGIFFSGFFPGYATKNGFVGLLGFYPAQNDLGKIPDTSGRIHFDINFYGHFFVKIIDLLILCLKPELREP